MDFDDKPIYPCHGQWSMTFSLALLPADQDDPAAVPGSAYALLEQDIAPEKTLPAAPTPDLELMIYLAHLLDPPKDYLHPTELRGKY